MSQVYHTSHQGPSNQPGYGPGPMSMPPPPGNYPSAVPPFGRFGPTPPPGRFGPTPPPREQSYQGYFGQQQPYYNHQHYGPEPLCMPFLRACLGTLCCCCLLEQCCLN